MKMNLKKKVGIYFAFVVLVYIAIYVPLVMSEEETSSVMCGVDALYHIASVFFGDISYDHVFEKCIPEANGIDLYHLYYAAKQLGLNPKAVKADCLDLDKLELPAIAHYTLSHYVGVLRVVNSTEVMIYDSHEERIISKKEFCNLWSGNAIEFGVADRESNNDFSSTPKLQVTEHYIKLGEIVSGEPALFNLSLRNTGNGIVKVIKVEFSCSCTLLESSEIYPLDLSPGRDLIIPIKIETTNKKSRVYEKIKVHTDDPSLPTITYIIDFPLREPSCSVSPVVFDFTDFIIGETVDDVLTIRCDNAYIDNLKVHATNDSIGVKKIDDQERNENSLGQKMIRYKISCNPTTVGYYSNTIEVTYHDSQMGKNEDKKITIPVMGRVHSSIEEHPSFISFNET